MKLWSHIGVFFIALNLWQFIAVPLLPNWCAWTLVPLALLNSTTWAAIHEGIHGNAPRTSSQVLAGCFGSSFHFLTAAHLTHHALNRTEAERLEVIPAGGSWFKIAVPYYFNMCGGLYLCEVLAPLVFLLPKSCRSEFLTMVVERASPKRRLIITEGICAVLFMALSLCLYGERWWLWTAIFGIRALSISSLEYIYHYGTATDDVNAAHNLWLPTWASLLLLNFNYHHAHHVSPKTPWRDLPKSGEGFTGNFFAYAARAWRGPV